MKDAFAQRERAGLASDDGTDGGPERKNFRHLSDLLNAIFARRRGTVFTITTVRARAVARKPDRDDRHHDADDRHGRASHHCRRAFLCFSTAIVVAQNVFADTHLALFPFPCTAAGGGASIIRA